MEIAVAHALDDRFSRDLRRHNLAIRLIHYEARTQTIRDWSGLPEARVRRLFRAYLRRAEGAGTARHRGPPPRNVAALLRPGLRAEATAAAMLCVHFDVVPPRGVRQPLRTLPSLARGERLCVAFEAYRATVPSPRLSIEHVVLLVAALTVGEDLAIGRCTSCEAALLVDPLGRERRLCGLCQESRGSLREAELIARVLDPAAGEGSVYQGRLF